MCLSACVSAVREPVDLLPKKAYSAGPRPGPGLRQAVGCSPHRPPHTSPEAICGLDVDRGAADPEQEQDQVPILEHPAWP